ncbi:MAG: AAA family ATPase [Acidobacteria bacterium]|nr:AAA family ATPase [Acidobacteriota bacterium]
MYSSIQINGYRGLDSFRMEKLGRVNLLVGMNNSGKTSILECIELLRSAGDPHVLSAIAGRRGEWGHADDPDVCATFGPRPDPLDVSHLFANHELTGKIRILRRTVAETSQPPVGTTG